MSDPPNPTRFSRGSHFRFSLGAVLLWTAIICLAIANVTTTRQLRRLERELESSRRSAATEGPLTATEVARQFQKNTTLGPISVTVKDVRYSVDPDSYKIDFSWTDTTTGKTWSSNLKLISDGYGTYYGQIRNGPFVQPLGREAYTVVVETPSPLAE